MVKLRLIWLKSRTNDAADALAVAICHVKERTLRKYSAVREKSNDFQP
jgi:Holliday junction resolvasome RuvABC endonuclease subunit